jgi:predicted  nucleic acid-binding Zn-ribbon protein
MFDQRGKGENKRKGDRRKVTLERRADHGTLASEVKALREENAELRRRNDNQKISLQMHHRRRDKYRGEVLVLREKLDKAEELVIELERAVKLMGHEYRDVGGCHGSCIDFPEESCIHCQTEWKLHTILHGELDGT